VRTPTIDAEPSSASTLGKGTAMLLAGVLIAHGLLAWQLRGRGIFTGGDDAAYLVLARALRGLSYRELQFVGEPIAARFPPGYPALLAVTGALFGERMDVVGLLGIAFSLSGIGALFDVVRRRWSVNAALVSAALMAINPGLLATVAIPASEMVFTSLTLWTLWAAERVDRLVGRDGLRAGVRRGRTMLAVGLACLAALVRSAGVTMPLALICHWVWRRQWRAAAVALVISGVFVGGWLAWTTMAPRREVRMSYIDDVVRPAGKAPSLTRVFADRLATNVPIYTTQVSLTQLSVPVTPRTMWDNVGWVVLLGGLFLVGCVAAWTRWNAAVIYLLGYCALLAVWPYVIERFLVPAVPLALAFMVIGASTIGARLGDRRDLTVAVLGAVLALFALRADAELVAGALDCDRTRTACATANSLDFVDAARMAGTLTPPKSRFITPKSATLYYLGGRQTVFWEEAVRQTAASFLPYLRRNGVTHILSTPVYGDYDTILQLVHANCSRFALVRSISPQTLILAFRDSAATVSDGERACLFVRRALERAAVAGGTGRPGRTPADSLGMRAPAGSVKDAIIPPASPIRVPDAVRPRRTA
jgi:hypothetical protein